MNSVGPIPAHGLGLPGRRSVARGKPQGLVCWCAATCPLAEGGLCPQRPLACTDRGYPARCASRGAAAGGAPTDYV
jgi:hypothetical protein